MAKRDRTVSNVPALNVEMEQLECIRHALLIGLASYGEIERLQNAQELAEAIGREVPDQLRVLHPTGQAETVGEFAAALREIDHLTTAAAQDPRYMARMRRTLEQHEQANVTPIKGAA